MLRFSETEISPRPPGAPLITCRVSISIRVKIRRVLAAGRRRLEMAHGYLQSEFVIHRPGLRLLQLQWVNVSRVLEPPKSIARMLSMPF